MFRIIKPLAIKLPLTDMSPGIVPIVTASITLAFVKYKFADVSITLAVVNNGVTAVTTLELVKYKLEETSTTSAVEIT
jgi:hypothetical protein